jgi:hypothetical protein
MNKTVSTHHYVPKEHCIGILPGLVPGLMERIYSYIWNSRKSNYVEEK